MAHIVRPWLVLGLALCSASSWAVAADGVLPPARRWIPEQAVAVLEVSQPRAVLDLVLGKKVADQVTAQPAYKALEQSAGFQRFVQVVGFLEGQLGTEWKPAVYKLLEGGVTGAVLPGGGIVLFIDSGDEELLSRLHEIVLQGTRDEAEKNGQPDRVASKEVKGVTVWTFNGTEAHAIFGKRLVLASNARTLEAVLEHREHPDRASIDASARYQAAKKAAGQEAAATAYADLKALKQIPRLSKALSQGENPMGELLFSGIRETLKNSSWLALALSIKGQSLAL
ncbi:MAG: hypothetical protein ACP5XB_13090, partial [Isosphaeraceae bacterium]